MYEISGAGYGPTGDWLFLDVDGVQAPGGDDDEIFERWLASLTPAEFERTLDALFDDPINRFFDRTA